MNSSKLEKEREGLDPRSGSSLKKSSPATEREDGRDQEEVRQKKGREPYVEEKIERISGEDRNNLERAQAAEVDLDLETGLDLDVDLGIE